MRLKYLKYSKPNPCVDEMVRIKNYDLDFILYFLKTSFYQPVLRPDENFLV